MTNCIFAQNKTDHVLCRTVLGVYPVDSPRFTPFASRARFEIRSCPNYNTQLLGFKANARVPSLIEKGDEIVGVIQKGTWIVLQMSAGIGMPTLVARFRKGEPILLGREEGDDGIRYTEGAEYAILTIPLKNILGFREGQRKVYRLKSYGD